MGNFPSKYIPTPYECMHYARQRSNSDAEFPWPDLKQVTFSKLNDGAHSYVRVEFYQHPEDAWSRCPTDPNLVAYFPCDEEGLDPEPIIRQWGLWEVLFIDIEQRSFIHVNETLIKKMQPHMEPRLTHNQINTLSTQRADDKPNNTAVLANIRVTEAPPPPEVIEQRRIRENYLKSQTLLLDIREFFIHFPILLLGWLLSAFELILATLHTWLGCTSTPQCTIHEYPPKKQVYTPLAPSDEYRDRAAEQGHPCISSSNYDHEQRRIAAESYMQMRGRRFVPYIGWASP